MGLEAKQVYNYGTKKDAPLVEKLEDEELQKFEEFLSKLDERITNKYGEVKTSSRLYVPSFKQLISSIKGCKFEGIVVYTNKLNRQMINFTRIESNKEDNGEEALATLNLAGNEELKLPWIRRFHVFDHPFKVEYREKNGLKFVALIKDFDYFKYSAKYHLIIKEVPF